MAVFIVLYDYEKGATFFAIEARTETELLDTLSDISIIAEPEKHPYLTADTLQRVRANVRQLADPVFDVIRRTT